jgi:hypothetical protein
MQLSLGVLSLILGVGAISAAAADEPATPPAAPSPVAPASAAAEPRPTTPAAPAAIPTAPVTATAAVPAAAATPASTIAKPPESTDPKERHLLAEGYKSEMRNGDRVFCRKEQVLGSRLGGQKVCGNADDLIAREEMDKANAERTERLGRSGMGPCNGCSP